MIVEAATGTNPNIQLTDGKNEFAQATVQ